MSSIGTMAIISLGIVAILILYPDFFTGRVIDPYNVAGFIAECSNAGDCAGAYICTGIASWEYHWANGTCVDEKCGLTSYAFTNCTISETICSADCDTDGPPDCPLGKICDLNNTYGGGRCTCQVP